MTAEKFEDRAQVLGYIHRDVRLTNSYEKGSYITAGVSTRSPKIVGRISASTGDINWWFDAAGIEVCGKSPEKAFSTWIETMKAVLGGY